MTPHDQGTKAKEFDPRPVVHENSAFAGKYNRKKTVKKEQTNETNERKNSAKWTALSVQKAIQKLKYYQSDQKCISMKFR